MKNATWKDERSASMRYIAKCYLAKGNIKEAKKWLYKAIAEAPHIREPYIDMSKLEYSLNNWYGVIYFDQEAFNITNKLNSYITDPDAWGSYPYDLLSISYFNIGDFENSLKSVKIAYKLSPNNIRIVNNLKYIEEKIKKEEKS